MSAAPTQSTEPDFGPTLPQLARRWLPKLRRWQQALLAALALAILFAIGTALFKAETAERTFQQTLADSKARDLEPLEFNFDYSKAFQLTRPAGSYVQIEQSKDGVLISRMRVSPIDIEPQSGRPSGYLPLVSVDLERRAARRYPKFRLRFEGRSRVNFAEGYQFAFTSQLIQKDKPPRQLFGRTVVILEPHDLSDPAKPYPKGEAPTKGVLIEMLATTLDAATDAAKVGDTGRLKLPFRTFRFGD